MLQLTGKCLGVDSETVQGPSGSFVSTTITLISGTGTQSRIEQVRVGRDFPTSQLPKEGESVALEVVVSAYAGRNGAGYRLTALSRVASGARVAPVANAS